MFRRRTTSFPPRVAREHRFTFIGPDGATVMMQANNSDSARGGRFVQADAGPRVPRVGGAVHLEPRAYDRRIYERLIHPTVPPALQFGERGSVGAQVSASTGSLPEQHAEEAMRGAPRAVRVDHQERTAERFAVLSRLTGGVPSQRSTMHYNLGLRCLRARRARTVGRWDPGTRLRPLHLTWQALRCGSRLVPSPQSLPPRSALPPGAAGCPAD